MIPFIVFFFLIYIFLNSIVLLCSTFNLLPLFLFHLNFHINFFLLHFHLYPLFLPSCLWQKGQYSLSLSFSKFFFSFGGIFFLFFLFLYIVSTTCFSPTNGSFCYCWLNCHITFVNIFGIPIFDLKFFFFSPFGFIWFGLIISCFEN